MKLNWLQPVLSFFFFCVSSTVVHAQFSNMLNNPFADENGDYWVAFGDAMIEEINGDPCFAIRDGGYILQDISLNENDEGNFVLIIGLVSGERINVDGTISGLPYLYGYMTSGENITDDISSTNISSYLQVSDMLSLSSLQNDWVVIWDVFQIEQHTKSIRIFLSQAAQRGVALNGSIARFDELGVYVFASLNEASEFVDQFYDNR